MGWAKLLTGFYIQGGLWITALLFLAPLQKKTPNFYIRVIFCVVAGAIVRAVMGAFLGWAGVVYWADPIVCYAVVSFLFWQCADIPHKAVFYCSIWVFMLYRLTAEIGTVSYYALQDRIPCAWLVSGLIWGGILAAMGGTVARWMPEKRSYHPGPRQLTSAFLLWALFLGIGWLYRFSKPGTDDWSSWIAMMQVKVLCIMILYLQHELFQKSAIRQELILLNHLWLQQKNQYCLAKENIALINQKCHDLKHQIKAMRVFLADEDREKYLQEIEKSVRIYDILAKTGNEVLDTVLTEKSLNCEANGIQANCVADGRLLSFMDPVDVYTIFGNAMDNAIESVRQNTDREQRIIDVQVYAEKQMLVIRVMNSVAREIQFDEEGLPVSTKERDGYHGFGLRSIRNIVKKYDGFLSVKAKNGIFSLQILLPMQNKSLQTDL